MKSLDPNLGKFEVIFLRKVLVYSDRDSKTQAVECLVTSLKPGGYFHHSFGKPPCHHGTVAAYSTLDLP